MPNPLSPALLAQVFSEESNDPFLTLVTLSHPSFTQDICLVTNTEPIISQGIEFLPFPMKIKMPVDDGESARFFVIEFDNVGLELIDEIRTVVDPINVKLEMILASMPDDIQIIQDQLKIQSINYTSSSITANIILDNFLNTQMNSERYGPQNFPGLF